MMTDRLRQREIEVERARAALDLNLEALQSKLTLESLADEAIGALKRSRYSNLIDDGFTAFRHNPVPALIAGAAVALLAFQVRSERARRDRAREFRRRNTRPGNQVAAPSGEFAVAGNAYRHGDHDRSRNLREPGGPGTERELAETR